MGDHKDLANEFAVDKIKDLAENIKTCMLCTYNLENKLQSRPMSVQKIDDLGQLWFLSDRNSSQNAEITQNPTVEIFFSEPHDKFLTLHGTASILYNPEIIHELYDPIIKVWMPGGEDDPNLSIIKVIPEDGYYWNNKNGKMVAIAKMTAAFVTGKTMDDGIEGSLKL
ncbi:pyridoxamine 5'-phosphate oxidase family protein [Flavobacterium sp. MMLR14_040]|uniref:pyridoxamine 5'-phosphate oxidase family protein n=1 Tax=Flavobacterium sp. MMLR14_040 TaxID=3093843 RepID=UPI00298FDE29|nr:pyridoxamine 5'-phosphate oxidase family protein [Flavobacterium sp. MMLR14_040]MDW8850504.1 pyridoxamine 5'-phosphate oxidase family protein [Flavobacterium sp. MMLR14_040]